MKITWDDAVSSQTVNPLSAMGIFPLSPSFLLFSLCLSLPILYLSLPLLYPFHTFPFPSHSLFTPFSSSVPPYFLSHLNPLKTTIMDQLLSSVSYSRYSVHLPAPSGGHHEEAVGMLHVKFGGVYNFLVQRAPPQVSSDSDPVRTKNCILDFSNQTSCKMEVLQGV